MSPPNWLPPLNFHSESQFSAVASQLEFPHTDPSLPSQPTFLIRTNVSVNFYPDNNSSGREKFRGLSMHQEFSLPCYKMTSPSFFQETISNLLREMLIPFELNQGLFWLEKHLSHGGELLLDAGDLVNRIKDFACHMRAQRYNAGHNVLPMNLSIIKMVKIPYIQFTAWNSWYDNKLRDDPRFGKDYEDAISRPRTEQELMCGLTPELNEATKSAVLNLGGKMLQMTLS